MYVVGRSAEREKEAQKAKHFCGILRERTSVDVGKQRKYRRIEIEDKGKIDEYKMDLEVNEEGSSIEEDQYFYHVKCIEMRGEHIRYGGMLY